ncbi:MAG TPA: aminoglycoside phosphotransferase family protein [Solirubrobacteraceae bacterium]|nr:aminoglycoside phosphotransferase family protein [Solirubrobacteraceae bacterium]
MHPEQLTVTTRTVRELVDRQFPAWRDLPIRQVHSHGTVNALFRLGETLVARFALLPGDAGDARRLLEAEARAARELLGRTHFPTPEPVALGDPGPGYPLPWAVQTWLPGHTAFVEDPSESTAFAHDLAEFIADVRAIDTRGRTFRGSGRGGDLREHDEWVQLCLARSERLLDVAALRRLWAELRDLPRGPGGDVMSHSDLIAGNLLVADGRLAGVIDVGGLRPADPALDLVAAWHVLGAGPRQALRENLRCDDLEWSRGIAWAFEQAIGLVWYYAESNPPMARMGRRPLQRIVGTGPCAA